MVFWLLLCNPILKMFQKKKLLKSHPVKIIERLADKLGAKEDNQCSAWGGEWQGGEGRGNENEKHKNLEWKQCCCSVAKSRPTLRKPWITSRPVCSVHHRLLEFAQTHAGWVSDTIRPSHPLLPASRLIDSTGFCLFVCLFVF